MIDHRHTILSQELTQVLRKTSLIKSEGRILNDLLRKSVNTIPTPLRGTENDIGCVQTYKCPQTEHRIGLGDREN